MVLGDIVVSMDGIAGVFVLRKIMIQPDQPMH